MIYGEYMTYPRILFWNYGIRVFVLERHLNVRVSSICVSVQLPMVVGTIPDLKIIQEKCLAIVFELNTEIIGTLTIVIYLDK